MSCCHGDKLGWFSPTTCRLYRGELTFFWKLVLADLVRHVFRLQTYKFMVAAMVKPAFTDYTPVSW